jgi:hypothetical protein
MNASGLLLAEGARFSESISRLSQATFVPKGVYRFRSHDAANRHAEDCLVQGMARLAAARLLLTKKTLRDKDMADRIIIERALDAFSSRTQDDDASPGK